MVEKKERMQISVLSDWDTNLKRGGSSFTTSHTGQTSDTDDLKTLTPSVLIVNERFAGKFCDKNSPGDECSLYKIPS